ncbi:hypothetical protein [Demequina muriae]|uniref:Uncharacterized protein n=1 Tax=Demequina muriae TaxID=3051664 RepID=A0ABT8GIJ4_9MICO|nr:hypothetical protein [Demequina sp. EGI L300058]MDN4481262.1 hypothetical protein [Demequina sp. EGI L300058]
MSNVAARRRLTAALATIALAAVAFVGGAASPVSAAEVGFSVDDFAGNAMGTRELVPGNNTCSPSGNNQLTVGGGTMTVDVRVPDTIGCQFGSAQVRWTAPTAVDITQGGADRIILNYRDVQSGSGNGVVFALRVEDVDGNVASVGGLQRNVGSAGDFLTIRYAPAYDGDVSYLSNADGIDKTRVTSITLTVAATSNNENVAVTFDGIGTNVGEPTYEMPSILADEAYGFPASQTTTRTFDVTGFPAPDVSVTNTPAWMTATTSKGTDTTTVTLTGNPGTTYGEATINVHADVANSLTADRDVRIVTASPVDVTYTATTTIVDQPGPVVLGTATAIPDVSVLGTPAGLPAGTALAMDGDDVVLTGTPTESGTFDIDAEVGNEWEQAAFARSLEVHAPAALSPVDDVDLLRGEEIDPIVLEAVGYPAPEYSSTALPDGLALSATGTITGTPTAVGTTSVTVTAANDSGTSQQTFDVAVGDAPVVTLPDAIDAYVGASFDLTVVVDSSSPATVVASGLPTGLSVDSSGPAARIVGTPTLADGTDEEQGTAQVTVTNEFGATVHPIDWTVLRPQTPVIEVADEARLTLGDALDLPVTVTSVPSATVSATGLPAGVEWVPDADGGRLVGAPEAAGTSTVTIAADNGLLAPVTATVSLVVDLPEIIVDSSAATVTAGDAITVSASGFQPGESVEVWLNSDPILLASTTAGSAGAVTLTVAIPADVPAGEHTLVVQGASGAAGEAPLTVLAAAEPAGPDGDGDGDGDGAGAGESTDGALSSTGAEPFTLLAAAVLALATGGMMLVARRRIG